MQPQARIPHVPALDGVRGAAVLAVLFFHAGHFSGGFLGVDLFFTLSGFLITSLLLAEWRSTGSIALGRFWARRARRLLPAVLVVVAAVGLYAYFWAQAIDLGTIRNDGLATLAYVANWHAIASGRGYWDSFSAPSPFEHAWSLAIEEQFYVIWPLLVVGVFRWASRRVGPDGTRRDPAPILLLVTVLLAAASAIAMVLLHHRDGDPSRVYLGSDTRAASILIGAALALILGWKGAVSSRAGRVSLEVVAVASVGALVWAWSTIDGTRSNWLFEGGMTLCALAAAAIIASVVHPRQMVLARVLAFPPLRWCGLISYGLYLWHWPLFVLLSQSRTGMTGWPLAWLRIAVSVAVAVVSYIVVEQPIRRGALVGWRSKVAVPAGFAASAIVLVAATTGAVAAPSFDITAPTPTTAPATTTTIAPTASTVVGATTTTLAPAQQPMRVLMVGDSVGWTIAKGMEAVAATRAITVDNAALFGCGVAGGDGKVRLRDGAQTTETEECRNAQTMWAQRLADGAPSDAVLALGAWDVADRLRGGAWVHPCQASFDAQYTDEIAAALGVLGSTGARVHVLTYSPLRGEQLGLSNGEMDKRTSCLNSAIRAAVGVNARDGSMAIDVIDIGEWTCPDGQCRSKVDGVLLRPDGVHYDGDGGPLVGAWVIDQLERWRDQEVAATNSSSTSPVSTTPAPTTTLPVTTTIDAAAASTPLLANRAVSTSDRLRVVTVGDSLMFDAEPGVVAALQATGAVDVTTDAVLGFSLEQRPDWTTYDWRQRWAEDIRTHRPDVVVAMWGGWDEGVYERLGSAAYSALLSESIDTLQTDGARVVLIGTPPVPRDLDDVTDAAPFPVLQEFKALAASRPGTVTYVDLDPVFAADGFPTWYADGQRIRKLDLYHFCPAGAARIGEAVLATLSAYALPSPSLQWDTAAWTSDGRYDNPPGACTDRPEFPIPASEVARR
ncbi:MAG: acyltransferase family protein [Acidimicrobiia bacterium]